MGPVWDMVSDIMEGKVKKVKGKDFKIPKSLHHFNGMGGVPDDVLKDMLTRVVESVVHQGLLRTVRTLQGSHGTSGADT